RSRRQEVHRVATNRLRPLSPGLALDRRAAVLSGYSLLRSATLRGEAPRRGVPRREPSSTRRTPRIANPKTCRALEQHPSMLRILRIGPARAAARFPRMRESRFHAVAFVENVSLRDWASLFPGGRRSTHELRSALDGGGEIFAYPFGAVVFRDVPPERREAE